LDQDFIADCNIINFATVTKCTQLRSLRTGSYAPGITVVDSLSYW